MSRRVVVIAAAMASLAAMPAAAQQAHRPGWWYELTGGYGYLRVGTATNQVQRSTGTSWTLRAGHQVAHNVSLGLSATTFRGNNTSGSVYTSGLLAIAVFNPSSKLPLFITGGVGISDSRVKVTIPVNQIFEAQGTGVGLTFSAAYDIRVGRRLAITPIAQTHIAAVGDFHFSPTQVADDVIATAYQVGIGITWR